MLHEEYKDDRTRRGQGRAGVPGEGGGGLGRTGAEAGGGGKGGSGGGARKVCGAHHLQVHASSY